MTTSPKTLAPRNSRLTFALRFLGWTTLALVLLVNADMSAKDSYARPAVADSAAALIEAHDCTGQDDPKHAVITIDGVTRYVGQPLTDKAIEQAMFGVEHGITVHRFCA